MAELVGATPRHAGLRAILTPHGLAVVDVVDRFTEQAIDLHWEAIAEALAGRSIDLLEAFREIRIDGHQLAFGLSQLPRTAAGSGGF